MPFKNTIRLKTKTPILFDDDVKHNMVRLVGLEPTTNRLEGGYSIQLNYKRIFKVVGPEGLEPPTLLL